MAHRNHRAVNERYPRALAESLQPHEKHKREEDARHEFHEAVVGYGGREILGKMPLDEEHVVVLEIGECAEMVAYKDCHYLALGHHAFTLPALATVHVRKAQIHVFFKFCVQFL